MKVRFTLDGAERYDKILAYLRLQSPPAADRLIVAVDRAFRRLGKFPLSGAQVHEFPDLSLKQVIVGAYRFFYLVDQRARVVVVVDVWHVAQIPEAPHLPAP